MRTSEGNSRVRIKTGNKTAALAIANSREKKNPWMAVIWVEELWIMTRCRSQAMAAIQKEDMTMGKSIAALKNLHRISVCFPKVHSPATIDQNVTGHVKLQSKKSEKHRARMKELRGSPRSWRSRSMVQSKQRLKIEPMIMTGMYRPQRMFWSSVVRVELDWTSWMCCKWKYEIAVLCDIDLSTIGCLLSVNRQCTFCVCPFFPHVYVGTKLEVAA